MVTMYAVAILALFIAPASAARPVSCTGHHLKLEEDDGCITPGLAICRADPHAQKMNTKPGDWKFGIDADDGYVKLWNPLGSAVYQSFPNATELCVGEDDSTSHSQDFESKERPYLRIKYESGEAWLFCDGIGKRSKDAQLKMVEITGSYPQHYYDKPILKFKKGSGDRNTLWSIDYEGRSAVAEECEWYIPS